MDVTFPWTEDDPAEPAQDVLLRLTTITEYAHEDDDLSRLLLDPAGDGLWRKTVDLPPDLRVSYHLCVVRDRCLRDQPPSDEEFAAFTKTGILDPANPLTLGPLWPGTVGETSILELPQAPPQPYHERRPGVAAGILTEHHVPGPGESTRIWIYIPPGSGPASEPMPLAVLLDGRVWKNIDATPTFDNLIASGAIPPAVFVLVDLIHDNPRRIGLTRSDVFLPFLVRDLPAYVAARVPITDNPDQTVLAGQSLGGLAATYAGLHAPQRYGQIITQSGSFWWPGSEEHEVIGAELIAQFESAPRAPIRLFQEAGSMERSLLDANRFLHTVLVDKGYDVTYREFQGGHDYACWRGGLADGLIAAFSAVSRRAGT